MKVIQVATIRPLYDALLMHLLHDISEADATFN